MAKAYRLLRAIFNTTLDDGLIRRNPCRIKGADRENSPERPVLTVSQVYALADAVGLRYRALILLAAFTSLRWAELQGRCPRRRLPRADRSRRAQAPGLAARNQLTANAGANPRELMARVGHGIRVVQENLVHTRVTTTERYAHVATLQMKDASERTNQALWGHDRLQLQPKLQPWAL